MIMNLDDSSLISGAILFYNHMALPFFYINNYDGTQKQIVLDEDTSKHIVQVLRMKDRRAIKPDRWERKFIDLRNYRRT